MTRPSPTTLSTTTEKQLSAYGLAALAGVGVLTTAQVASADILAFATGTVANNTSFSLLPGGPTLTLAMGQFTSQYSGRSYHRNYQQAGVGGTANEAVAASFNNYAANLQTGATIGAMQSFTRAGESAIAIGSHFTSSNSTYGGGDRRVTSNFNGGNFHGAGAGYLGIAFTDPNNFNQTDYGWVQIDESDDQTSIQVLGGDYDNTGASILAGQTTAVPEPGSLALLAGGAACLAGWRRRAARRREAAATATGAEGADTASAS